MRAIQVTAFGDSDVLQTTERDKPDPDPGAVRIEVAAAGINFADVQQRRGRYPGGPEPPFVPGLEAAGTIDAVGEGVDREVGERVVTMLESGGYAEYVTAPAFGLLDVPEFMAFEEAAGFPVQFLTAWAVLHERGGVEAGERVLVHAAAGGVGSAAVQLADAADAEVFATASTAEKLNLAERLGADHLINYVESDFREEIDAVTDGAGVDLVLDGVGGETFDRSLDVLAPYGRLVTFGVASSEPTAADATELLFGNVSVVGFHLGRTMANDPGRVLGAVPELTEMLADGTLEVVVGETFDLADAAEAHAFVEGRGSVGKVVLEP
jgi:NADPH2:quinone reductase